jgi:hypothetical protein
MELEKMHEVYCRGGLENRMAPHAIYQDPDCPHPGCGRRLAGIDFRVEQYGQVLHDALVHAWWTDVGFAGRCPGCRKWVHFKIKAKLPISDAEAAALPNLPDDWAEHAFFL